MSHHDDDNCNFSTNESFQDVLARGTRTPLTRRNVIRGGTGMVALSALLVTNSIVISTRPGNDATIAGTPPEPGRRPPGCPFAPRCGFVQQSCRDAVPKLQPMPGDGRHKVACPVALEAVA